MEKETAELLFLHKNIMGEELRQVSDFAELSQLLHSGHSDFPSLVDWSGTDVQSIVLKKIEGERILFYNPDQPEATPPGAKLVKNGPFRQVVSEGVEAMDFKAFESLFSEGRIRCFTSTHSED